MAVSGTITATFAPLVAVMEGVIGTPTPPSPVIPIEYHLQIGRTGMDVALNHPYAITQKPSGQLGRTVTISGHIKETGSLKDANALRESLLAQSGRLLPVICNVDPSINGYYYLTDASVELSHSLGSLSDKGFFPYSVTLEYVASEHLATTFTGGVMPNAYNNTSNPRWMGRTDLEFMSTGGVPNTGGQRGGSEGQVRVIQIPDDGTHRRGIRPKDFYTRGCRLFATGDLIAGENIPADIHDPMSWEINNTLVKAVPIIGGIRVSMWQPSIGDWTSPVEILIYDQPFDGNQIQIDAWRVLYILRNDPDEVTVRVGQPRGVGGGGMRMLDLTVRKGMRHIHCFYQVTYNQSQLHIRAVDGCSAVVDPWGLRRSVSDASGNRWFIGTRHSHTNNTGTNTMSRDTTTGPQPRNVFDFFVAHIAGGANAAAYDVPGQIGSQYLTYLSARTSPLSPSDTSIIR